MDIHRPPTAYPTLPSPAATNLHNPSDLLLSTPTNGEASQTPQPYPSPSPLPPTTTTSIPSTKTLTILPCTLSSLPFLLPLLTTNIPLNPFTALMLKPPHNIDRTAHQNLAAWLYTVALQDPRAKIIALVAVQGEDQPTSHDSADQPSTPGTGTWIPMETRVQKKPHARVIGVAWLQHFLPSEKWEIRYPMHIAKRAPQPPPVLNTKGYARALKLLYTHREACVGPQGGWYVRNIATALELGSQDGIDYRCCYCCHLLEYVGAMFAGEGVFWQGPPFRAAGLLYQRMGWRWGMCGGRVVEGAGEGLDWVGWVERGDGEGDGEGDGQGEGKADRGLRGREVGMGGEGLS